MLLGWCQSTSQNMGNTNPRFVLMVLLGMWGMITAVGLGMNGLLYPGLGLLMILPVLFSVILKQGEGKR